MLDKVLIIKPSGIGDIVHSLPVAIGLKKINPNCKIHWIVFSKFREILMVEYVDKVIPIEKNLKGFIEAIKIARSENYDVIIDLQALTRTAIIDFLSGKKVISTSLKRELAIFLPAITEFRKWEHAVERNFEIVKKLANGKNIGSPMEYLPWIKPTEEEISKAKEKLGENGNFVLFSLGSRGEHKVWPPKNFSKLIKLMKKEFDIVPVFVGTKDEEKYLKEIEDDIKKEKFINLIGETTLREAIGVTSLCSLTISNDNGMAHISAALDKPTFILFGPTQPAWFYPYNKKSGFIWKNLPCSPCGIKTRCKTYECMKEISPEEVFFIIKNRNYLNNQ